MDSLLNEQQGTCIELYNPLSLLLSKAGMHAPKWLSNLLFFLANICLRNMHVHRWLGFKQYNCHKHSMSGTNEDSHWREAQQENIISSLDQNEEISLLVQ